MAAAADLDHRPRGQLAGGPAVDGQGRVQTTIFASRVGSDSSGYGVPTSLVREELGVAQGHRKTLLNALRPVADSFGRVVKLFSTSLQGDAWGGFFTMLADLGPQIQEAYGRAFISFLEALATILTVTAPYALRFADANATVIVTEREAIVWRASDEAIAAGVSPPFVVRPGLIVEMLALYDDLRRREAPRG